MALHYEALSNGGIKLKGDDNQTFTYYPGTDRWEDNEGNAVEERNIPAEYAQVGARYRGLNQAKH
jgi:hypothetical protein